MTLRRWRDIWVNEGFAEWSSWYWSEHTGQTSAQQFFDRFYATNAKDTDFWNPPPGTPARPATSSPVDLRARRDDPAGAAGRRSATTRRSSACCATGSPRTGTATRRSADFVAFTEHRFPRLTDLPHFFDVWLYQPGKPTDW